MVYPTEPISRLKIPDFFFIFLTNCLFSINLFSFPVESVGEQFKTTQWWSLPIQWPEQCLRSPVLGGGPMPTDQTVTSGE